MEYQKYLEQRAKLVAENANPIGNILNDEEKKVDDYLTVLKEEVFNEIDEAHLYKMPVLREKRIWNSRLYDFIKILPKGSDLHVHATALLPSKKLLTFLKGRNDVLINKDTLIIKAAKSEFDHTNFYTLDDLLNNNLVSEEEILNKWTLLGLKHNQNVWDYFENLFEINDGLEDDLDVLCDYYIFTFRDYLANGVFHIEIHTVFSTAYERTLELAKTIRKAYYIVKKEHPELIVSIICASLKYAGIDMKKPEAYLKNALRLRDEVKDEFDSNNIHDFIVGYDFVNEEDRSMPLKDLAKMILKYQQENPDFKLFIHGGESLYAQSNNLIDAYLLNAQRVGHGMNLYRYPTLLESYRKKEICLEVCLISNQSLRYVKDLRLHPCLEYLRRGLAVALCSDDPFCQENEQLSDDFYAAVVCWDLHLADIKQLAINSLTYGAVDGIQKKELYQTFKMKWQSFISETLRKIK